MSAPPSSDGMAGMAARAFDQELRPPVIDERRDPRRADFGTGASIGSESAMNRRHRSRDRGRRACNRRRARRARTRREARSTAHVRRAVHVTPAGVSATTSTDPPAGLSSQSVGDRPRRAAPAPSSTQRAPAIEKRAAAIASTKPRRIGVVSDRGSARRRARQSAGQFTAPVACAAASTARRTASRPRACAGPSRSRRASCSAAQADDLRRDPLRAGPPRSATISASIARLRRTRRRS